MDKHKLCLIYNPVARGEKARLLGSKLHFIAQEATILGSKKSGDAGSLAAAVVEQGFKTIVAAGGDGTVNEVVNGIGESKVKLGILPIGTINVFAHEMGLLLNQIQKYWDTILHGEFHLVDLAVANGHFFVQLAGVGLDAQVLKKTDRQMHRIIGPLSYIISAAKIIGHPAPKLIVEIPQRGLNEAFIPRCVERRWFVRCSAL
jgi:diacylglycerol kinase family enzyme